MKNIYSSLFGESPATQQARENRNLSFQSMLDSRRQAAQQAVTDNVKMARYNALGNVLTTMVQPLGWAAGGSTGAVQKYDDRQYIDAFNRAVKASDDLRNIGTAEDQYRFNLADEDYKRMRSLEDSERQYQFQMDKQQQQFENQMEKQRQQQESQMEKQLQQQEFLLEKQQREHDAKQAMEEWKETHKVSRKGTGLSIADRILLKEIDAYNKYVEKQTILQRPVESFDKWMETMGYEVTARTGATPTPTPTPQDSNSTNQPSIKWAN